MKFFDASDYAELRQLFFNEAYAGYKPQVLEAPNGDGKIDATKRYLHVALKYNPPEWALWYLARAHFEACRIAEAIGVPEAFYPKVENGTLRVLEYPAGAGSAEHTDFDLFTLNCWRSTPGDLRGNHGINGASTFNMGELGEIVELGKADSHWVVPQPYAQRAIVYFAMPANDARMPDGSRAIDWIADRYARSRVYK